MHDLGAIRDRLRHNAISTLSFAAMTVSKEKPTAKSTLKQRPIRSFVLRTGRTTAGQRRAMRELWPLYGIALSPTEIEFDKLFTRAAPVILEIGFGNGDNLVSMACGAPKDNFLGIEVHEPGVGHCLLRIEARQTDNIRIIRDDAVEVLQNRIPNKSLSRVNLFFPDPWHKKRHHKRRIVQPAFITLLAQKLKQRGIFHVATDWPNYAEHIAGIMSASDDFEALPDFPADRITTRFDTRGKRLGHDNWERAWCTCNKSRIVY